MLRCVDNCTDSAGSLESQADQMFFWYLCKMTKLRYVSDIGSCSLSNFIVERESPRILAAWCAMWLLKHKESLVLFSLNAHTHTISGHNNGHIKRLCIIIPKRQSYFLSELQHFTFKLAPLTSFAGGAKTDTDFMFPVSPGLNRREISYSRTRIVTGDYWKTTAHQFIHTTKKNGMDTRYSDTCGDVTPAN